MILATIERDREEEEAEVRRQVRGPNGPVTRDLPERLRANEQSARALGQDVLAGLFREAANEIEEGDVLLQAALGRRVRENARGGSATGDELTSAIKRLVPSGDDRVRLLALASRLAGENDALQDLVRASVLCPAQKAAVTGTSFGVALCRGEDHCRYCDAVRHLGDVAREKRKLVEAQAEREGEIAGREYDLRRLLLTLADTIELPSRKRDREDLFFALRPLQVEGQDGEEISGADYIAAESPHSALGKALAKWQAKQAKREVA